jgi:hypothetical protein
MEYDVKLMKRIVKNGCKPITGINCNDCPLEDVCDFYNNRLLAQAFIIGYESSIKQEKILAETILDDLMKIKDNTTKTLELVYLARNEKRS